jgi:antitoxin component YwqK of YwqJK toxin-antitoxin module
MEKKWFENGRLLSEISWVDGVIEKRWNYDGSVAKSTFKENVGVFLGFLTIGSILYLFIITPGV